MIEIFKKCFYFGLQGHISLKYEVYDVIDLLSMNLTSKKSFSQKYKLNEKVQNQIISQQNFITYLFHRLLKIIKIYDMDIQQSPFETEVPKCRSIMKKLRKKIYKYSTFHKPQQKPKDSINNIINRLKQRQIPEFLLDSLKKRRSFELTSIKNVTIPQGIPLFDISNMRFDQEKQIQSIYSDHKQRMKKVNQKKANVIKNAKLKYRKNLKLEKRSTTYSSTEQQVSYNSQYHQEDSSNHPYFEAESHQMINSSPYLNDINYGESSINMRNNEQKQRSQLYFDRTDKQLFCDEAWMRFDAGIDCLINYN